MKHIIDILDRLSSLDEDLGCEVHHVINDAISEIERLRALIANSPQTDGMVIVPSEPTNEMLQAFHKSESMFYGDDGFAYITNLEQCYKAMLSAYKPQAENTYGQNVAKYGVDVANKLYAESQQADDVRKDAERLDFWIELDATGREELRTDYEILLLNEPNKRISFRQAVDQAIDKARE